MRSGMNRNQPWLLAIILIALALRLHNLTYHSLWFDEAISVYWARQSIPRILEVGLTLVEDRLPPLYYLTLKGWTALFGFSEVSVRLPSVLAGVLLVPVVAGLARFLVNERAALVSALLVALNPFLIWYAQEARMYAPAVLFSSLAVWAFLRLEQAELRRSTLQALQPPYPVPHTRGHVSRFTFHVSRFHSLIFLALFTLFALAGLYSHLYTGFLLPALGVWLMISYPHRWRMWLRFALSGLLITLAFAPLALATWRFSGEAAPGDPFNGFGQRAWQLLQAFTLWKAPLPASFQFIIPISIGFLALMAYVKPSNHSDALHLRRPMLLITLLLLSPFFIANLLLFRNHLAFFGERYFIGMAPWLLILAAAGADNLSVWIKQVSRPAGRLANHSLYIPHHTPHTTHYTLRTTSHVPRLSTIPFLFLFIAVIIPIPGQWSLAAAKEAWRQSVAYLAEHARPNHGILIHPDWVRYPFQFYFQGPGQTYAAFSNVTSDTPLDGPLQGVVSQHPVIWLIQAHTGDPDPDHRVEQWFAARYPLVTELYPPGITLKAYAPGYQLEALPAEATPANLQFEPGLRLVGYQADSHVSARDELFHPPSGWAHVTLYWTATQPILTDVAPFVQLIGPEGVWGVSLERAGDALKLYPASRWPVEPVDRGSDPKIIRHDLDVNLNPATPPGRYQLVVGLQGAEAQYPLAEVEVHRDRSRN